MCVAQYYKAQKRLVEIDCEKDLKDVIEEAKAAIKPVVDITTGKNQELRKK